jgi:hypothetical protein
MGIRESAAHQLHLTRSLVDQRAEFGQHGLHDPWDDWPLVFFAVNGLRKIGSGNG